MYIIEKVKADRVGRVGVTKLFAELPEEVVVTFDTNTQRLMFATADEGTSSLLKRRVDAKGRVSLPRWMTCDLGEEFFLTTEGAGEHFLIPAKFLELH